MSTVRQEVHFRGRVQGVGFRWTVQRIANHFEVVGYVRNLPDRQVQLVAEGDESELDRFIDAIRAEMNHYITEVAITEGPAIGEFDRFQIRY